MMSTITPLAERGRGHRYGVTCAWFASGALLGGLALGGFIAALATAVGASSLTPVVVGTTALVTTLIVLVSDVGLAGVRLPVHHRQVNERWLDAYRPWVYGVGFGFQIGTGLATYVTTAAVYLLVVLGALTGDPLVALALGGAFGLARGLAVTLTHGVATPVGLLAFHRRFATLRPVADRVVRVSVSVAAVVLCVAVGPLPALVSVAVVSAAAVASRSVVGRRRRGAAGQGVTPTVAEERSVALG
jgi:MFS family permease